MRESTPGAARADTPADPRACVDTGRSSAEAVARTLRGVGHAQSDGHDKPRSGGHQRRAEGRAIGGMLLDLGDRVVMVERNPETRRAGAAELGGDQILPQPTGTTGGHAPGASRRSSDLRPASARSQSGRRRSDAPPRGTPAALGVAHHGRRSEISPGGGGRPLGGLSPKSAVDLPKKRSRVVTRGTRRPDRRDGGLLRPKREQRLCLFCANGPHLLRMHLRVGGALPLEDPAIAQVLRACAPRPLPA